MAKTATGITRMVREDFFLHKLHSLTGIVPVGFYMVQHLTLNSFAFAGPDRFNGVIHFFEGIPAHVFMVIRFGLVWLPLIFHAVYGLMIVSRSERNYVGAVKQYRENGYYNWQRWTGILAFLFLCYHMATTSVAGMLYGQESTNYYHNWAGHLSEPFLGIPYFFAAVYVIGVVACSYHLAYGLWNFGIRWGITISEKSQKGMAKFAMVFFFLLSGIGILALSGFFRHQDPNHPVERSVYSAPLGEHAG
jgi:succinate dehydrogenase / fumarate reductase, cytochrome b subunit